MLSATGKNGKASLLSGPELLLLPINGDMCGGRQMLGREKKIAPYSDACRNWKATSVSAAENSGEVEIRIAGGYAEASGDYTLRLDGDGVVNLHYAFTATENGRCDARQIGVVFTLPNQCRTLSWRRKAFWSSYPDDHIGRAVGTAAAFAADVPLSGLLGPKVPPKWSWSLDGNEQGTNDFRSTKMNVLEASLYSAGGNGLRVLSDGSQHVRSWVDGDHVCLLAADFAGEGASPPMFTKENATPNRPLRTGTTVQGTVRLEIH